VFDESGTLVLQWRCRWWTGVWVQALVGACGWVMGGAMGWGQTVAYDFGSPSADEQMMIELVNRSRAHPGVEAQGFRDAADPAKRPPDQLDWNLADAYSAFGVNMSVAVQRISALPVVPPLAPNAKLLTAARQHTQWMFTNRKQTHIQPPSTTGGDSIARRITATGYDWVAAGENIYAYGSDHYHVHAGYEVDWGGPDYGMQRPAGHRLNNHSKDFREIGVGVRWGYSGYTTADVGPLVNTVNFGAQRNSSAFVTGVAYYDRNGNQRYDINEGISGLRIDVSGASHHAVTAPGGGYAVPVPVAAATRAVTLSGLRSSGQATATIAGGANVKIDFVPPYVPPVVADPGPAAIGRALTISFPTTVGATAYDVVKATPVPAAAEPFDTATNLDSYVTAGRYHLLQSSVRLGSTGAAIHLAHPVAEDQWVMLKPTYLASSSGSLTFQSWLRGSSQRQVARVQISADDGRTWTDAWTRVGTTAGATAWAPVTVPLGAQAGRLIRLRFNYTLKGNSWNAGVGVTSGWFIDDITFSGVEQLSAATFASVPATGPHAGSSITPTAAGTLVTAARPVISGEPWDFGPVRRIDVSALSPFQEWVQKEERRLGLAPGTLTAPEDSPHHPEGVPALVRYALGLPADAPASERLPQIEGTPEGLCVVYFRDRTRSDVVVGLEVSGDYLNWHHPGEPGAPVVLSDIVVDVDGPLERRCAIIAPANGRVAARLSVRHP